MKRKTFKYATTYLLPQNNFWVGIGSVLNIAGSYFNYSYSETELEADRFATLSDWKNVGEDLKIAQKKFESEK